MSDKKPIITNPDLEHSASSIIQDTSGASPADFFEKFIVPSLAEFVGVFLFVFVGCLSVQTGLIPAIALCHGFAIAILIMGVGGLSGGHFNPAVTLGVTIAGAIDIPLAVSYVVSQVVGGVLGASFVRAVEPAEVFYNSSGGAHTLGPGVLWGWGLVCEVILTLVLVFTVLMTAVDSKTKSPLAPIGIGFAVAVDICAGAKTSGASMNPARSFGPAVVASPLVPGLWTHHYVYWLGPILGAVVAGLLYRVVFASREKRLIFRN